MTQAFELLKNAVDEARRQPSLNVEVVECNVGFEANGKLSKAADAPIQIRFVAYPRHVKDGSAMN